VHFQALSAFEMQNSSVCGAAKMVAMLPHLHAWCSRLDEACRASARCHPRGTDDKSLLAEFK